MSSTQISWTTPDNARIAVVEAELLKLPQVECPLEHRFAPGVYCREIFMPAGTFIIGQEHRTEHFNIVLSGKASVLIGDEVKVVLAPDIFVSKPGVRKVLYIHEDMRWATIHPTDVTDVATLENILTVKTDAFLQYQAQVEKLKQHIAQYEESNLLR